MAPPEGRTAMALARAAALADTQGSRLARGVPAAGGRNDGFLRAVELDGRVVGEGADGKVVGAVCRATRQRRVVKLCKDSARAAHEADMCARVAHPNVIECLAQWPPVPERDRVLGSGWPRHALIFPEADASLRHFLDRQRGTPLPSAAALCIGIQMAAGLQHVHAQGVIHRGIKPANVLVSVALRDGNAEGLAAELRVQIADFSQACWSGAPAPAAATRGP